MRLTKGQPDPDGNLRYNQLPEYLLGATPYLLATALNETDTMRVLVAAGADPKTPMMDGTTPTMASMGVFPGVFTFIPFVKIGEKGAQGDNTAYFQRKRLFSEAKVLETMKLAVEFSGGEDINAARGALDDVSRRQLEDARRSRRGRHGAAYRGGRQVSNGDRVPDQQGCEDGHQGSPRPDASPDREAPGRQFITGGDNGEKIGDEKIATLLAGLGAQE